MSVHLGHAALPALFALAACGGSPDTPTPAPTVATSAALSGQEVVEQICSQCHTLTPPPNLAPPFTQLSLHLRQTFASVDEAVAHVVTYAPAPDSARSVLPPMAIDRFGLMPPQPLPEPLLDAAARYIWSLGEGLDPAMEGMGAGGGMGMGRGMGRGGGGSL